MNNGSAAGGDDKDVKTGNPIIRSGAKVKIVSPGKRGSKTEKALKKDKDKHHNDRQVSQLPLKDNNTNSSAFVRCRPKTPIGKRYNAAMKTFIPYRPPPKEGKELPLQHVGCCSYTFISWMTSPMIKAYRVGLSRLDLMPLDERDSAKDNAERLQRLWQEEMDSSDKSGRDASLARVAWRFLRTRFLVAAFFMVVSIALQFLGPSVVLKAILDFLDSTSAPAADGWWLVAILTVVQFLRNIFFCISFNISVHTVLRIHGAVQYLSYSKLLRLASVNDGVFGMLVTFFGGDAERIAEAVVLGSLLFATPVLFLLSAVYAWVLVGPWSLLGFIIIFLFYPLMGGIAMLTAALRRRALPFTDRRTSLMDEILSSIRLVKMYAWEESFQKRIKDIRAQEVKILREAAFLQSLSLAITPSITVIAVVATLIGLTMTGFPLSTADAFTLFSIFGALQFTVGTLPATLRATAEAKVAMRRLQDFMELPEYVSPNDGSNEEEDGKVRIRIKNATFGWTVTKGKEGEKDDKSKKTDKPGKSATEGESTALIASDLTPTLFDLDLEVAEGQLLGVAGPVGAGKSSLVSAIMGEMRRISGDISVFGQLALVSQQAWIFNGTLRENVLFGAQYDKTRFDRVVEACALTPDLQLLPDGDLTEIGERGVNLSGGQKQRVNLARALYSPGSSIYLLDDPLSAVDAGVAAHIFRNCIRGELKEKTVILVTHGMQFLEQCDRVVFLRGGRIVESGTHAELVQKEAGEYSQMLAFDQSRAHRSENKDVVDGNEKEEEVKRERLKSINEEEEDLNGGAGGDGEKELEGDVENAGWGVLVKYLRACGGYHLAALLLLAMCLFLIARLFTSVWLQIWLDAGDGRNATTTPASPIAIVAPDNSTDVFQNVSLSTTSTPPTTTAAATAIDEKGFVTENPDLWFYQWVYLATVGVMLVLGLIKGFYIAVFFLRGSTRMHDQMLERIMRSPMSFFDVTPAGRILNRFSKDLDEMDVRLPFFGEFTLQSMLLCLSQVALVCALYPWFIPPLLLIMAAFIGMDHFMNRGVVWTRKLDNMTKSPVLHHLSSAAAGAAVIRGYGRQGVFRRRFAADLDAHNAAQSMGRFSNRWFTFRMDLFGAATIVATAVLVVASKGAGFASTAIAGLALSSVFQVCTFIPFVMRIKAELRARFNSVERICQYANDLIEEAPAETADESKIPPTSWPEGGAVEFAEVFLRYRPELPPALRGVTLKVSAGEKVGVVGRTGAGKTSLIASMLRLTEVESGKISIDGVDLAPLGLNAVRRAVAVIPQDPVLFAGTLRYNLDPFGANKDEDIWKALEKAHLKDKGCSLDDSVDSEGENFSVGEKQLICLARALLRGNKILLLDEATASVDVRTDFLIQSTIREAFADCTVITVAHRLHTVLNYDRIVVMQEGQVVEFASPDELMKKPGGIFADMMKSVHNEGEQEM